MSTKKIENFHRLQIGLASPSEIQNWAKRYIPPKGDLVGEVTSWETVNYKTLKPEPNGLFCQRIFGPILDYTCACGKKSTKIDSRFCLKCGVERTSSRVRRYRLGFIKLKQPIVHTLYATHKPSPLSSCLDWSNKRIQSIMYATEFCHLAPELKTFCYRFQISSCSLPTPYQKNFKTPSESLNNINNTSVKYHNSVLQKFLIKKQFSLFNSVHFNGSLKSQPILTEKENWVLMGYPASKMDFSLYLYGIAYDMSWRQVEDFQEFLFYSLEQARSSESFIPSYNFTNNLETKKTKRLKQIPDHEQYYPIQTGGFVYQKILSCFNLFNLQCQLEVQYQEIKNLILFLEEKNRFMSDDAILKKIKRLKQAEKKCLRRLTYVRDFHRTKTQPAWMMLSYLPVLPPGLRPITSIRGELIVSDINSLYRKVLTRNKRLINTTSFAIFDTSLSGSWASWCYNLRQVQESIDNLLKTGSLESGKTTKSLLDALKGKRGRFRQHLLGKRVDYSGRSVIVVGPELQIHECGLPKQIALELFQPFLIQKLRNKKIVFTTTAAKALLSERKPIVWSLLAEILKNHPVLLNRAPTLHRLGIQAFLPKLVEGKAILLHPLVCPAFNADFDGDQMAVHVPLSAPARAEAFQLLWSRNHLLAPASGQPLLLPSQDMVLGFYYLTISKEVPGNKKTFSNNKFEKHNNHFFDDLPPYELTSLSRPNRIGSYFSNFSQVKQASIRNLLKVQMPIWVKWEGTVQNSFNEINAKFKDTVLEIRIDKFGNSDFIFNDRVYMKKSKPFRQYCYIRTTPGRILMHDFISTS